jgi:hypothetical protein
MRRLYLQTYELIYAFTCVVCGLASTRAFRAAKLLLLSFLFIHESTRFDNNRWRHHTSGVWTFLTDGPARASNGYTRRASVSYAGPSV